MWVRLAHCSPSLGCCSLTTAVRSNVFPNWLVSVLWLSLSEKNPKEGNAKKKNLLVITCFLQQIVVCGHLTETCNLEMDNIFLQSKSCAFLLKPTCFQRYNLHAVLQANPLHLLWQVVSVLLSPCKLWATTAICDHSNCKEVFCLATFGSF